MAAPVGTNVRLQDVVPHVAPVALSRASTNLVPPVAFEFLRFCCIADTFGTGIENWAQEKIIAHWDTLTREVVFARTPPYDQGLQKGFYSDDTEMSLGLLIALQKQKILTPDFVAQCFFDVYEAFKRENGGTPRGGYGTFKKIAKLPQNEQLEALRKFRHSQENFRNGLPGNGSGMRILPVLFYAPNAEVLLNNVIAQTISTHNHAFAVLTNLVYVDVASALLEKRIAFDQVLLYASDFLQEKRAFHHVLPTIGECLNCLSRQSAQYQITIYGDAAIVLEEFKTRFSILNTLSAPACDVGINVGEILPVATGSFTGGKIGLLGLAHLTLYATLYCWKWTMVDFERESYFSLMKRCISFGGDIDTLLAHVIPVSFLRLRDEKGGVYLPDWLVQGCVEINKLEDRLAYHLVN